MNNLEMRYMDKREMIANEMDECYELLFVYLGVYSVGYEINKKKYPIEKSKNNSDKYTDL